jgi:hypothetical protein
VKKSVVAGAVASAVVALASAAQAQTITNLSSQGWTSPASENSGGGSAAITSSAPRSGNGSLELTGDRVRVELNDMYAAPNASNNLGTLSQWTDLSMDYEIATDSTTSISPLAGPALRIDAWVNGVKTEFVWEQNYQPGVFAGVAAIGDWNVTAPGGNFYVAAGASTNVNNNMSLSDWISSGYISGDAIVTSINVGLGSGISAGGTHPHEFVDNIRGDGHDFNFEVAGVPEPASWALMIAGFGGVGAALRRRRQGAVTA